MAEDKKISVAVVGAAGKMGREVVKAVSAEKDMSLAAAVDSSHSGQDIGMLAGIGPIGVSVTPFLESTLSAKKPDVMIDFTRREAALSSIETSLKSRVACVVGTTGFTSGDLETIKGLCEENQTAAFIAPNFAIGAVLLMKFAKESSKYFSWGEIIELHHEKKLDAPSGTALRTADLMLQVRSPFNKAGGEEKLPGARGGMVEGIRIHSVRLPGLVAHQEVLFGGGGELLTIRHDSMSRESFMPGVLLAVRKVSSLKGLVVGLENIIE